MILSEASEKLTGTENEEGWKRMKLSAVAFCCLFLTVPFAQSEEGGVVEQGRSTQGILSAEKADGHITDQEIADSDVALKRQRDLEALQSYIDKIKEAEKLGLKIIK